MFIIKIFKQQLKNLQKDITMESVTGMLIPVGTIVLIFLIFLMQMSFWQQTNTNEHVKEKTLPVKQETYTYGYQARAPTNKNSKFTPTILKEQSNCIIIQDQPSSKNKTSTNKSRENSLKGRDDDEVFSRNSLDKGKADNENDNEENGFKMNDGITGNNKNNWKCACEFGFLPAGMLKTFGNAEAIAKLGIGQCYHKQ